MELTVVKNDGDQTDRFTQVAEAMQARFDATRRVNPRGYKDAFEARQELHLSEVVGELGGTVIWSGDGECVVNFSDASEDAVLRAIGADLPH